MVDLASSSVNDLSAYSQVWLFSTDEMNAPDQQTIASFVTNGGNLVIFPYLPDREMNQKPCTILRDTFNIKTSQPEIIDSPLIKLYNLSDIKCSNPLITYSKEGIDGATPIAYTLKESICGFEKNVGKGKVIHLGTWLGFDTEGHKQAYLSILKRSSAQLANSSSTNDFITVRQKFNDNSESLLFVGNYYNENQSGKITYKHPKTNDRVQLPLIDGEIEIPPLYAFISPISIEIGKGINILHTTSDVIGISSSNNIINLYLTGSPALIGEMVLEGKKITKITSAEISEKPIMLIWHNNRIVLNYVHSGGEIVLTIKMLDK
jgi:beta-galactosidase